MSRLKDRRFQGLIVTAVCGLALLVACSTDSPTAPLQVPPPPTDGGGPDAWNITVTASPSVLIAGEDQPSTISIQIRDRATGANPPPGSTIALSTTIGEFDFSGSTALSTAAVIDRGSASALLFPSSFAGTATVTAESAGSRGSTTVTMGTEDTFITSVSPSSGPGSGGTGVTIKGVGFFAPLRVPVWRDSWQRLFNVPPMAPRISVTTPAFSGAFKRKTAIEEWRGREIEMFRPRCRSRSRLPAVGPLVTLTGWGFTYNPSDT